MCVLLLFPFQHEEKSIDQKSSLLPFMLFTCCRSSHGACLPLTWSGWSREGGNWTRASSPPQGFWPLTLLSFATTCSDGTADSFWRNLALWPAGVGNCWVLGACVWGQREQHGAGSIPLLWGHWHFAELCSVLQAMLCTRCLEVRLTEFLQERCVFAAHQSFCCFVLFLPLSLALYSSCNHSEKNYSCKMQTE